MLDDIDLKILRTLEFNARITNEELAHRIGLSATPTMRRVRALEEQGVIKGYAAVINNAAVGHPDIVIFGVTLDRHDDTIFEKFEAALKELPEVLDVYLVSGQCDYYVKAAVAGTQGYERFLREGLYQLPGVLRARSHFTLRCIKHPVLRVTSRAADRSSPP